MAANKFWGGESSSSSSDSDSSASDDDKAQAPAATAAARGKMRWAEESSSEEEVEQKRTVRSHTDKRYDQLVERIKKMSNHIKIDDFSSLIADYGDIIKMLDKLKNIVEQDGGPPGQFVKAICSLEEYVDKTHADLQEKKQNKGEKLTENKQKAFNTLRAKVRKGNRAFQDQIDRFKENPQEFESEADSEEEAEASDSGSDAGAAAKSSGSSSSSSDSDSDSDSDSSGSSDSDSDSDSDAGSAGSKSGGSSDAGGDAEAALEKKMLRWVITPDLQKKREKEKADKDAAKKSTQDQKKTKRGVKRGLRQQEKDDGEAQKSNKEDFTAEDIMKKVSEIALSRGKRGFDRKIYFDKLRGWLTHAEKHGPLEQLYIYSEMVAADFDNTGGTLDHMKLERWNEAIDKIQVMLPLLVESYKQQDDGSDEKPKADDGVQELWSLKTQQERFVASAEKLDKELYKALQFTVDVYGDEYQQILGNSSKFMILLKRMYKFFEETKQVGPLGVVSSRLLEQLYYKPDPLNAAVYDAIRHSLPEEEHADWVWPEDSRPLMAKLCHSVFARAQVGEEPSLDQSKLQARASLSQAFHLALHDHFQEARDLMHLGNLAEKAAEHDVHTAILYNRTLAQMGLCAFRLGKIQEAHNCLMDTCMHNKARELLAQGLVFSKQIEKTQEQERSERERQLPYHMHINLEVMESAHHICAMLLEIPNMAMESIVPTNKRVISRVLRRALESQDKQVFSGPPENAKEAVVSASRALQKGDWVIACGMIDTLKLWEHVDLRQPENGKKIKDMIVEKIKIEALRTFLFSYASIYDAFHIDQLVGMFGLDAKIVHSVVSKMMIKEEITAFWDESSKYVLVQHVEPSPLQRLSLVLADRAALCVQHNEQLVDQKTHCGYGLQGRNMDPGLQSGIPGKGGKGVKGGQGQGKGGKGGSKGKSSMQRPVSMRGWENARAGAHRSTQRGWARPA